MSLHCTIPVSSTSFDTYQVTLQSAAISATKGSMGLPTDLAYHRSLDRNFGKRLDACSDRILGIASQLLHLSEDANEVQGSSSMGFSKAKGKRRLGGEDVEDEFHSLVVDVVDPLLERADTCLDEFLGRTKSVSININLQSKLRAKVTTRLLRRGLDPALAHASHLPKPQLHFRSPVDNRNATIPWRPQLKIKHHALVPLEQSLITDDSLISPHLYKYEITHFTLPPHLVNPPSPISPEPLASAPPVTYISDASQLAVLLDTLTQATEIAVDLEHHSYRSYAGFVCLMQISTRTQDWIIDCLVPEIRVVLECLNEVFTNPNIVKVFHGADNDIVWLQQDFNLYVVNLFDTYHATKVLDFPKRSLSALLEMFCDFTPDKRYQLADWRIRPLPAEMLLYAQSDTHFLLYIYDNLRNALLIPRLPEPHSHSQSPLLDVIQRSVDTALRTYVREVYDAVGGTGPGGWDALSRKWNRSAGVGAGLQADVFKAVHAWRDRVARDEDESTRYVMPNHYVFHLAERPPNDLPALLATFQPVPPLVRRRSLELLDIIRDAVTRTTSQGSIIEHAFKIDTRAEDDVRIVGLREELATEDLWGRQRPGAASFTTSSTLRNTVLPPSRLSHIQYSAPTSALLGTRFHAPASNIRYCNVVARIHSTLALSPSPPILVVRSTIPVPNSTKVSGGVSDYAAQAEIPYVPQTQRQHIPGMESKIDDTIVVLGQRQRKRKRKGGVNEAAESSVSSGLMRLKKQQDVDDTQESVEPFDFDSAPNILDEPSPIPVRTKKRREKGAKTRLQHGNFGTPPRNMSEMRSGNQSRTFG